MHSTDHLANATESLSGRALVVVAHQDDETACAVLLQRAREPQVVFTTDGAPNIQFFWSTYPSREHYAAVRHAEALRSLGVIGILDPVFLQHPVTHQPFRDQELFRSLPSALEALEAVAAQFKPDALIAPAYEGGHPDHDTCSFLVSMLSRKLSIPAWEMPLYHRSEGGVLVYQRFRVALEGEIVLHPSSLELARRDAMLSKYVSQTDITTFVSSTVERFRPQSGYDYSHPPHPGALNYEVWRWAMTGADLCAAFQSLQLAERPVNST